MRRVRKGYKSCEIVSQKKRIAWVWPRVNVDRSNFLGMYTLGENQFMLVSGKSARIDYLKSTKMGTFPLDLSATLIFRIKNLAQKDCIDSWT